MALNFHLPVDTPEEIKFIILTPKPAPDSSMPKIYLIRHGKAAASFTDDLDPGLDDIGKAQAQTTATQLKDKVPLALISSPLKRALETAQPLAQQLNQSIVIEARISEIPSPGISLEDRGAWLQDIMKGRWNQLETELQEWKQDMIHCLLEANQDTAFFSHFVAINALVGAAESRQEVLVFRPDNGSVTTFETDGHRLTLLARGAEASTKVN